MSIVILGPQRPEPNLKRAVERLGVEGKVAVVTAGWRHDENETAALEAHLGLPVTHLKLYAWFDEVLEAVPEVAAAYRERQARIGRYKELYRLRLRAALGAVEALRERLPDDPELVEPELDRALSVVRDLDEEVLTRLDAIRMDTPELLAPWTHRSAADRFDEVRAALEDVDAICIAGGHVAVLLNRMQFFGLHRLLPRFVQRGGHVFAWSAGAMCLAGRVVLFYDDPPDGRGDAEILDRGFGLLPNMVFFPHGRRRLRLDDSERVARLAARFAPSACLSLESGAWLNPSGSVWRDVGSAGSILHLRQDGRVCDFEVVA
jgi:hypothetical protein